MNICFVNRLMGISRGGGENFDLNIARNLAALGHKVHFFAGRKIRLIDAPLDEFPVTYVKSPYLRWLMYWGEKKNTRLSLIIGEIGRRIDLWLFEQIAFKKIRQSKYDVIDVFQLCALPSLASKIQKDIDKPAIVRWPGPPGKRMLIWKNQYSANIANGAAFKNLEQYDAFAKNINVGVNTDLFKPMNTSRKGVSKNITILFVGRLIPVKNLPFLIKSFSIAIKSMPELQLVLVGDGIERARLQQMVLSLKINKNIIFAGTQPTDRVIEYYNSADIFVLPSSYDNFPNVILEAMACELPVIATNVGGITEQIKHNENGLVVASNCVNELVDAILMLASQPDLRQRMGKRNQLEIVRKYSWKNSALQLIRLYNESIKNMG
jgi:glycosyltransferase involved in cell wall biosynthesis